VRTASDEVRHHWPFGNDFDFATYLQIDDTSSSEFASMVKPAVLVMAKRYVFAAQDACATEMTAATREVVVGAKDAGHLILVRYEPGQRLGDPAACLRRLFAGEPVTVPGSDAAFASGDNVVALKSNLVVFGDQNTVRRVFDASPAGSWPDVLDLQNGQHLRLNVRRAEGKVSAEGFVASSREFMRLQLDATFPDESAASRVEQRTVQTKKDFASSLSGRHELQSGQPILDGFRVVRDGRSVTFAIELKEPPLEQSRDFGMLFALTTSSVRKYLSYAKIEEARRILRAIAERELEAWRSSPPGQRQLVSLPPVPQEVPHGNKYASVAADWKPWESLHFSLDQPQYFQYSVVAARDGQHADVIGRGDLDGNGRSSLFKLGLAVDSKRGFLIVSPIEEMDPEE